MNEKLSVVSGQLSVVRGGGLSFNESFQFAAHKQLTTDY
jgi:hypothetical protein